MSTETITLGGRVFKPIKNSTVEHDYWTMSHVREAGLDNLTMFEDQHPTDFARGLLKSIYDSGKMFALLGGLIIPADADSADWTPALAKEQEAFIRKLTAPEDKETVRNAVVPMLIGFFTSGVVSLQIIPRFSPETTPAPASDNQPLSHETAAQ